MSVKKDLTGQRYGRLIVLERAEPHKTKSGQTVQKWKCLCDCGNEKVISHANLQSGKAQSCGCLHKESAGAINRTHGLSNKCGRLYPLWKSIKYRCFSETSKDYPRYGGRGITMCEEWKNNFSSFHDWALANGYKEEKTDKGLNVLTIDRIDPNGNYEPGNCRFVTNAVQACNKRTSMTDEERYRICPVCGGKFKVGQRKKTQQYCSVSCGQKGRRSGCNGL